MAGPDGCAVCDAAIKALSTEPFEPTVPSLSMRERQGLAKAAERELWRRRAPACRKSLATFVKSGWHVLHGSKRLLWAPHLQAICDHVQAIFEELARARGDEFYEMAVQQLLINVPPRSLKSEIVSVFAPAWAWSRWPSLKIRCVSANPRVSSRDSQFSRRVLASEWYRESFEPTWTIGGDKHTKDAITEYENSAGGKRYSTGLKFGVTGEGTDVIIVDDPHDATDAMSEKSRQSVLDKWDTSLSNRVEDPKRYVFIGIMQRLHEDDWSGHVLAQGGWEHLVLPMEYEKPRPDRPRCVCETCAHGKTWLGFVDWRSVEGENIQPERFPPDWVAREKAKGSYRWAGQYQQRPAPEDGGMFKRGHFRFYEPSNMPILHRVVMSIDAQFKEEGTSNTAIVVLAEPLEYQSHKYVLRMIAKPMGITETIDTIVLWHKELRAMDRKVHATLVEEKANGAAVLNLLGSKISGMIPINPEGGKVARAVAMQPAVEAGNVMLPKGAPYNDQFLHEHAIFPMGKKDDIVDAMSQALTWMGDGPDVDVKRLLDSWKM